MGVIDSSWRMRQTSKINLQVALVGSDIPALDLTILMRAFRALDKHEASSAEMA